jgi:hypothetical protein
LKYYYSNFKNELDYTMGIYTKNNRSYTGAGVIVVEDYRQANNENTVPTILVARNKASHTISDFGGGYAKKHRSLEVTASEELLEESRNLINLSPEILEKAKYFDIEGTRDTYYRVYVVKVQNVASKYYEHNREIIDSDPKSKRQWKETDKIYHVPIENIDFERLLDRKKILVADIHDEEIVLHMRLRKALKAGKKIILETVEDDPLFTKEDLITKDKNNNRPWLDGTYQFAAKY